MPYYSKDASSNKLLGTSALLVVTRTLVATKKLLGTSALLVVTRTLVATKKLLGPYYSNKDASSLKLLGTSALLQ